MQVRKQNINIGKAVYDGVIKSEADGSIIVPDIKPDILKVLQADAEAFLCEKIIEDGKLTIKGKVRINVLYMPDGGNGCVQCIKSCFEFCETLKRSDFESCMDVIACCDVEKVSYKIINSRKISVNAQLALAVQVSGCRNCCYVSDVEESHAQNQYKTIRLNEKGVIREFTFSVAETLDIPQGKSAPSEILKSTVMLYNKEYRTLQGKLVVKGSANACILYLDENGGCCHCEFEIPFTEVFDMEELNEETVCDITYSTGECEFNLSAGRIDMSAQVNVCVKTEHLEELSALSDCYFTNASAGLSYETFETEEIAARPMFSAVMKELLQKDASLPDISGIYTVCAKPYITASQPQNGKLAVSGKTMVYVLYTTDNPQVPVCGISEEIPFSYMIDCECSDRETEAALSCECEHISYTISSANAVEVRCGIAISGKIIKKSQISIITDVSAEPAENKESGIVVYFANKNESLWDISKKYRVKSESIASANNLDSNATLSGGEKLIIPVSCK